ncbi:ribonuclease HII [Fangia hongkongensis]|uniref:ribonuclease HII n=1 Tax=Fangia hongkongensis TaxID=270495 RepID=UPI000369E824|nr:ribonuclease HII [Fangia hongkongensis]MBK2126184.1 ribonuclease HII [Fangia hongkongensis]
MIIVGVDEAGRGPLAGSVVAAAVILDPKDPIEGLADSKKLSSKKREVLYDQIIARALCYHIAESSAEEIDNINILQASLLAMHRAVAAIDIHFDKVLVDGNHLPKWQFFSEAVIQGDSKFAEISAASILAKVYRDRQMLEYAKAYPNYHFDQHKGYPTKLHMEALERYGPLDIHRKSFSPVARLLVS